MYLGTFGTSYIWLSFFWKNWFESRDLWDHWDLKSMSLDIRKSWNNPRDLRDFQDLIYMTTYLYKKPIWISGPSWLSGPPIYFSHIIFSRSSIYPLTRDGALSAHINSDHDHVYRYKSYYQKNKVGWIGEKILLLRHV